MTKRLASLMAGAATVLAAGAMAIPQAAGAQAALPTLNVALTGTKGVAVSGSMVSGAVSVATTFTGKGQGAVGLVRLNPGVTLQQAFQAVASAHNDINALTPLGSLSVDAPAPSTVETVLIPGNYVALNISGNGQPAAAQFTVTQSAAPAALPGAAATERAIEFGFRGPRVLHNGTMVREENGGYLVHMIQLIGVRNARSGRQLMALLKAGKDRKAFRLARGFVMLMGPASPGAMQQYVLHAKRGWYVEACFMDTQDGREHTRLGMERLVRVR